eukprot:4818005-Amphidinium_carterae.1
MSDRMLVRCFLLAATYVGYAYGTLPTEITLQSIDGPRIYTYPPDQRDRANSQKLTQHQRQC